MSIINRRKIMDDKQIINALSNMLQKRNNEIINLEIQVASLTEQTTAAKKEETKKAEDKSEKNK